MKKLLVSIFILLMANSCFADEKVIDNLINNSGTDNIVYEKIHYPEVIKGIIDTILIEHHVDVVYKYLIAFTALNKSYSDIFYCTRKIEDVEILEIFLSKKYGHQFKINAFSFIKIVRVSEVEK